MRASEYQRLHELTRNLQILDEVFEAFGDPDRKSASCGIIVARSERLAMLQQWRAEQAKRRTRLFARLVALFGDCTPPRPQWETVRDGPMWIYTRLSDIADVHVGIDAAGRVAIKLFDKGGT